MAYDGYGLAKESDDWTLGRTFGPHLHLGYRDKDNSPLDPLSVLGTEGLTFRERDPASCEEQTLNGED